MSKSSDEIFVLSKKEVEALPARPIRDGLFGATLEDAFKKFWRTNLPLLYPTAKR
jgi:hypothetical protein